MKNNMFIIILAIVLVFASLPAESHGDKRHLPQDTYTAIGKLVTGIREGLGCGPTEGVALSTDVDNSLRNLTRELFMNHTSSNQSLNYTALGESLTCEDINPTSGNALTLRNLLGCQDVNNQNSTIAS